MKARAKGIIVARWCAAILLPCVGGCMATAPDAAPVADRHASKVDGSDARCFTIERAAPPEGGLSIPRQFVCPVVNPGNAVQD